VRLTALLGNAWVKALTSRHLGEFANPNVKLPHDQSSSFVNAGFDLDQVTARRQNSRSSLTPVHYSGLILFTKRLQIFSRSTGAKTMVKTHLTRVTQPPKTNAGGDASGLTCAPCLLPKRRDAERY